MVSRTTTSVLFLLFMPVVIAEFLTGSTPLPSLLNPLTLPSLLGLYGCGALLVREAAVAWRKGWPTILALGCAYGVAEEGLDVKSWFNPGWGGLGILGTYGRALGVNWVWAVELTIFHAIFSITIPILLVSILFPESRGTRWLPGRKLLLVGAAFGADVLFGFAFFPYSPPVLPYLSAILLAVVFVVVGRSLPWSFSIGRPPGTLAGRTLASAGFALTAAFFVIFWVLPHLAVPPWTDVALAGLLCAGSAQLVSRRVLSGPQAFALAAGAVGFLIFISLVTVDFAAGPPFVGAALAGYLWSSRSRPEEWAPGSPRP